MVEEGGGCVEDGRVSGCPVSWGTAPNREAAEVGVQVLTSGSSQTASWVNEM